MTFLDTVVFPTEISYGSSGGPRFGNIIQSTPGGRRTVIQRTAEAPMAWQVQFRRREEFTAQVLSFARVTHGALLGFRFLDWNDFSTGADHTGTVDAGEPDHLHPLGVGDGSTVRFPLVKTYSYGGSTRTRRIRKPMRIAEAQGVSNRSSLSSLTTEAQMHAVFLDSVQKTIGTHFSIDYETGEVVFVTAPAIAAVIEWAGYFMVPARFGPQVDQQLALIAQTFSTREFEAIDVVEENQDTVPAIPERPAGGASYYVEAAAATIRVLSWSDGELVRINADAVTAGTFYVNLPAEALAMLGARIHIVNPGATGSLTMRRSSSTALGVAILPGDRAYFQLARNFADTDYSWAVW